MYRLYVLTLAPWDWLDYSWSYIFAYEREEIIMNQSQPNDVWAIGAAYEPYVARITRYF
jgi:hypothetical protein